MKKLLLIPVLVLSLNAQEGNQSKPLKHESGDVTIAANDAADYYSRKNFSDIKKIKISCINLIGEDSFKKILTDYIRGKSLLQAGRYLESRRLLEANATEIKAKTEEIIKYYRASVVHMCRINIFCKLPKGFRRMPHVTLYSTRARCFAIPF